ncbi:uncharacterized protein LOC132618229 [Lycium barbarum]|uniref:uncharacterized protein LOC132618229 n=1 Tax=Lycium barbarum TaxID=112863 RepID=UPI00293F4943|nr:uncharacterized protein LOC132618229 [Lycium barbarum]
MNEELDEDDGEKDNSSIMSFDEEGLEDLPSSPLPYELSVYDSEEEYCPNYPLQNKRDEAVWEKYLKQLDESEGFDIKDYPGACPMATVYPLPRYLTDPKNLDKLKSCAGRALKHYNDSNGTNHEVEDVLKVNGGGCCHYIYYITFTVKTHDGNNGLFSS